MPLDCVHELWGPTRPEVVDALVAGLRSEVGVTYIVGAVTVVHEGQHLEGGRFRIFRIDVSAGL